SCWPSRWAGTRLSGVLWWSPESSSPASPTEPDGGCATGPAPRSRSGELRRALPGARGPGCHSACMKLAGLLHRTRSELPGVSGVARVDRHTDALLRRLRRGDVVVLDQLDLDRATADALVAAEVAAVVNAAPSISGRFPNLGP